MNRDKAGNTVPQNQARQDGYLVFGEQFGNIFARIAQESYMENTQAFGSLFRKQDKFAAVMGAVCRMLYHRFRAQG